ncbi:T7SS effector LXG polymorphic toxin [Eubacterium sp. 1001713B170207_170306_E7]|uniref:T7SS effector LXG polymorphic toxin n=1 Tax=Eubacterium sp. 1001713B170207_170306_E7 TaxID=2787097 RepID=UPI00189774D2|nr:T7SS effector LXG polymorphic toxin [Eubacterium sp. 1001713B170207_170306_E7]
MSRLINEEIATMEETIKTYKTTVQEACYEQFKNAFTLTQSNNFRGAAADSYKGYISTATINLLNGLINVSEELATTMESIKTTFLGLESEESGSIDTDTLSEVMQNLTTKNTSYISLDSEIQTTLSSAGEYIAVTPLSTDTVNSAYTQLNTDVQQVGFDLETCNTSALALADAMLTRLRDLKTNIENISGQYHVNGEIDYDKLPNMVSEKWYKHEDVDNLERFYEGDAFAFAAGSGAVSEDQWAYGLASDAYAYAGYQLLGGSYEGQVRDGVASGSFSGSMLSANGAMQITEYLNAKGNLDILAVSGKVQAGFSKDYIGFSAEGSVAYAKASGSVVLGNDDFNLKADASAQVLSADGYAKCEADSNGNFAFGLGGDASLASAEASVGGTFFSIPTDRGDEPLFGAKASVSAGVEAGAHFLVESKNVIDGDGINLNATHIKLGGKLGLGLEVDLTIPTISFDWPW